MFKYTINVQWKQSFFAKEFLILAKGTYTQTKKETSDFHRTVSFDPGKMSQKNKTKCLSNVGHTKIGSYLIFIFLS